MHVSANHGYVTTSQLLMLQLYVSLGSFLYYMLFYDSTAFTAFRVLGTKTAWLGWGKSSCQKHTFFGATDRAVNCTNIPLKISSRITLIDVKTLWSLVSNSSNNSPGTCNSNTVPSTSDNKHVH